MSLWDSLGKTQNVFSNIAVPGKKNDRVPFGIVTDVNKNLPDNPGNYNQKFDPLSIPVLNVGAKALAGTAGWVIGQGDKATGGKLTDVLMMGAKNVRSNYAFIRELETQNAGMSMLAGLGIIGGAVVGGVLGAALGPAGVIGGASIGAALVGKTERTAAKAIGGEVGKAATFSEAAIGQEKYNIGRDVVTAASHIKGFESIGDTNKGFGAITSGLINFAVEMGVGPDIGAGKLLGAGLKRGVVGGITESGSRLAGKVFEDKFAAQTQARLVDNIDMINRTVAGETTAWTPFFEFVESNSPAIVANRIGLRGELASTAAPLIAQQSRDKIGLVVRYGLGDPAAKATLENSYASTFAQLKRYDSEIKTVEKGGFVATVYQDRNIVIGPDEALAANRDLIKKEIESLATESDWLKTALKVDSTMQDRTVSKWAWVERVRNDVAKERAQRKLELNQVPTLETGVGKMIQSFYSTGPTGTLVRMIDRGVDDIPKNSVNFNDPIQMPERFRTNIRSAVRHANLAPEVGLDWYNKLIIAGNETEKFTIVQAYTKEIAKNVAAKHGVSDKILNEVLSAYDKAHGSLLEQAYQSSLAKKGYMIDEISGEVIDDPVLVTQLANGAYLPDVKMWDKAFERYSKKYGAAASKMEMGANLGKFVAEEFNTLWRGFTLLRAGYPLNIIRDSSVRAYGDGVLFDMARVLASDTLERITNNSANSKVWQSAMSGASSSKKSADKLRKAINDREATVNILAKKLKEAGYDFANPSETAEQAVLRLNPNISTTNGVALVKTDFIKKFIEFDRTNPAQNFASSAKTIANIADDLRAGKGFTNPVRLEYAVDKDGNLLLNLVEGNHRLQAALQAGITDIPVVTVRSRGGFSNLKSVGKKSKIQPDQFDYIPGNPNPVDLLPKEALKEKVKITPSMQGTLDIHNELVNTVKELRRQEQAILSNVPTTTVGRDKSIQIYGYEVPGAFSGRFGDISRQQLSMQDDLRRALKSAKELEVDNVRRTRTGTKPVVAAENESEHLIAWEQALKDIVGYDEVARKILSGESQAQIVKWMQSPAGYDYLDRLGFGISDARMAYKNIESLVTQYAPTKELQKLALEGKATVDELRRLYPDVNQRPTVLSDMVKDVTGQSNPYVKMRNTLREGVAWLSTQPTSKLMFSPYFEVKYQAKFQSLVYNASLLGRTLSKKELEHFEVLSRQFAIKEYKEKLNSFHKDMNYNGLINYLLAFFPAVVEQYRAYGRIAAENPDFILKATQVSLLPQRLGVEQEDANGNKFIEVDLPAMGPLPDGVKARFSTDWFNVYNPTGSNIVSVGPLASFFVNQAAKKMNSENWLTNWALPFGTQANASGFVVPNTIRRLIQAFEAQFAKSGDTFNRDANMFLNMERVKFAQENGRQPGTAAELARLSDKAEFNATSLAWLRFISSTTLPAQPMYTTSLQAYADELNKLRQSGIINPEEVFAEKYPDYFLLTARLADSTSGVNPDQTAVALVKKNPESVKQFAIMLGQDNLNLLGAIFNDSNYAFSSSANAYLETAKIPGTNKKFRDVSGYLDVARQSIVVKGWSDFSKLKDVVADELTKAQIDPTSGYGLAIMKQYKASFVEGQKESNKLWYDEYTKGYAGSKRTQSLVDVLTTAANTPKLWNDLKKQPQWTNIVNYLNFRYDIYDELQRRKTNIDSPRAVDLAGKVAAYTAALRKDSNFAKFYDRYFDNDKFDYVYEEQ